MLQFAILLVGIITCLFLVNFCFKQAKRENPNYMKMGAVVVLTMLAIGFTFWYATNALPSLNPPSRDTTREASVSAIEQASDEYIKAEREYISIDSKSADAIRKNIEENEAAKARFKALPSPKTEAAAFGGEPDPR